MSDLRAVLFDMDGTLLDSEKLWDIAVYELSAALGRELTPAVRESTLGNSMRGCLTKVFAHTGTPATEETYASSREWLNGRVSELFAEGLPWRPGAKDTLQLVRDAGLRSCLVTNTERGLTDVALATIGPEFFDATVCGDEVVNAKPAPDPYLRGAELLGVPVEACLAIEDSPTGTESASAAGCAVLAVPSEIPIPAGPRRTHAETLSGVTLADLQRAHSA